MSAPRSVLRSTVNVMGMELVVHQLDTGERVVEAESVERFFAALGGPETLTDEEAAAIMSSVFPSAPGTAL